MTQTLANGLTHRCLGGARGRDVSGPRGTETGGSGVCVTPTAKGAGGIGGGAVVRGMRELLVSVVLRVVLCVLRVVILGRLPVQLLTEIWKMSIISSRQFLSNANAGF
jgi:hypothetical protein